MPTRKPSTSSRKSTAKKTTSGKTTAAKKRLTATAKKRLTTTAKKRLTASKTSKRTLIEPHKGDRRYVRRNKKGEFQTQVDVGRSLAADRRRKSRTSVAKGQGDRGDTPKTGILAQIFG